MVNSEQFYFDIVKLMSLLEKRNMVRKCVKHQSKLFKTKMLKECEINSDDYDFFWMDDVEFNKVKEKQKKEIHEKTLKHLRKIQIGIEDGSESLFDCKVRHEIAYKLMREDMYKTYPDKTEQISELIEEKNAKRSNKGMKLDKHRNDLAIAIFRMITIFKFKSNGQSNINHLDTILNCRYLMLDEILDSNSVTGFISEKDFAEKLLSNEEAFVRSAEYFVKKGKEYFTSPYVIQLANSNIKDYPYAYSVFKKDFNKRVNKINQRYDNVVNLFKECKKFN